MLSFVLLLGLHASPERAELALRWDAPPECPDHTRLLAAIDAALGEVTSSERRSLRVHGRVRADPDVGFVVRLELDDGRPSARELTGSSCEELTEAAALVIAMTIDPRLHEGPHEGPHAPAEVPEPERDETEAPLAAPESGQRAPDEPGAGEDPPAPSPTVGEPQVPLARTPDAEPEVARASPEPLRLLGRVHAGVGGGPLPGAAGVLGLAVGLGGRGWRAELSASYWTPRTRSSPTNPRVGVHAQLWSLGAHGCGEPRWRTLSFPLCAGVLAGAVHARGTGALEPRRVASRWVAVAVEPGLAWWVRPRLGIAVRAEGHVAVARPTLLAEPSGTVFTGALVGGALRVGLELRAP